MVTMENSDEILQILERFTRLKQKEIPKELEDYLQYVAKTGETIFKWSSIKYLFREKLLSVIKHFNEDSPRLEEIPNYPNVDPFNYETMKSSLLERLDLFTAAPFTVQRLCELLIDPRKQYSRIDKFMRALEKNILGKLISLSSAQMICNTRTDLSFMYSSTVVSTIDPGRKRTESENGDSLDSVVNGDLSLEVNIDIEMENEALINNGNAEEGSGSSSGTSSGGGAVKASCPRSDDNDLPKAKKAKLEIEGDDLPEADQEADSEVASKTKKDEVKIDSDETDAPQEAAEIEEPDEELEEADESKTAKQALNGSKQKETEESDTPTSETAQDVPIAKFPEAVSEPLTAAKEKAEEVSEKDAAGEPQEKIIEKQETEKAEKTDKPVEQSIEKPADEEASAAKESQEKDTKVHEVEKEKAQEKITSPPTGDKEGNENEKADAEAKPASADKAADEKAASAESKPETKAEDKQEPEEKESQNDEKTETASAKKPSPLPEEKQKEKEKEKADEPTDKPERKEDEKTAKAAGSGKEPVVEPEGEDSSPVAEELAAATTPQSPVSAAAESAETPPAEAVDDADADEDSPVAAVTPPALALNDQPMEDTPAEEEPRVSPSAAVEEVVMAESGPPPAAEMATDEADKEVAMEVDDTSQEVMIQ
ncbi:hypothetical protein KR200_001688 [Drosophila serrata]|nr:hypothetical protein KR200_001688 [Drosophila serrata]